MRLEVVWKGYGWAGGGGGGGAYKFLLFRNTHTRTHIHVFLKSIDFKGFKGLLQSKHAPWFCPPQARVSSHPKSDLNTSRYKQNTTLHYGIRESFQVDVRSACL